MIVKRVFASSSRELQTRFDRTSQILHNKGKGDAREEAFREVFGQYLPERYRLGRGQVIAADGGLSAEQDVVIFDAQSNPRLSVSESHDLFPIETVYGSVQVKSSLTSKELEDAYRNVASVRRLRKPGAFEHRPAPMMSIGHARPMPFAAIVAYSADRSLDAIASQAKALDAALGKDLFLAPELIVVLGQGLIGTSRAFRGAANKFTLPAPDAFRPIRRNEHHTLLRFFMQLQAEIDSIVLEPLDLRPYLDPVELVDGHVINYGRRWMMRTETTKPRAVKLSKEAIRRVVEFMSVSQPATQGEILRMMLGDVNLELMPPEMLAASVYAFNPKNSPPRSAQEMAAIAAGKKPEGVSFSPIYVDIDGKTCALDLNAFEEGKDFEDDPDADWDDFHPV